jgi:hypothetical protein
MSDAPTVAVSDGKVLYRASALGGCKRRLLAARLGYDPKPPPARLQQAFARGHELEPTILALLETNYGWTLESGSNQASMELHLGSGPDGRELYVVGHVDALGTPPGGTHYMPVDAKAFAQSTMDSFLADGILAFPHYAWQQSAYCEGFGVNKFCLPLYNKDTKQLTVKVYETHPYSYDDIQARVYEIEELAAAHYDITTVQCDASWGCPYDYLHDVKTPDQLPEALTALVNNYLLASRKAAAFAKAKKVLADLIADGLPDDGGTTFVGETATVSIVNNPKRMDTQKVKELLTEANLPLDDYYIQGEGTHITIKEKK